MERATGIEPAPSVWKTETLPLSYARRAIPAACAPYDGAYAYDDPYAANAQVGYGSQWSGHRDSRFTPGFNAPSGAAQGQHYETPIGYGSIFTSPMQ